MLFTSLKTLKIDVIGLQNLALLQLNIYITVQSVRPICLIGSNSSFVESALRHLTQVH